MHDKHELYVLYRYKYKCIGPTKKPKLHIKNSRVLFYYLFSKQPMKMSNTPMHQQQHYKDSVQNRVVFSTWNESRTAEYPHVLEYRHDWQRLGFDVVITPNDAIREDVVALVKETQQEDLLHKFDRLASTNMQFDFWRYAKLYMEGGIYADVDVDPLVGISYWHEQAERQDKVVLFEESPSIFAHSTLLQILRPWISNYQEFPSYASCLVIAPQPKAKFFLDLLQDVDPEQWIHSREPRRTLMTVGPGHVTRFAKSRTQPDVILAPRSQGQKAYLHIGFGTWKPSSTLKFEKYGKLIPVFLGVLFLWLGLLLNRSLARMKQRRKDKCCKNHTQDESLQNDDHFASLLGQDKGVVRRQFTECSDSSIP
jgi:Glycosyltransferase sugar-binding region containing DXD motif